MTEVRAKYDKSWKEALSEYFKDFLAFFFPAAHSAINWTKPPVSREQELQKLIAGSATTDGVADKLYQVWLLDEQELWILIHIEVQSDYDVNFEKRMYTYNYRAIEIYDQFVVSIAILGDTSPTWRPNQYLKFALGCEASLKFPTVKLIDYEARWQELESNNNPFAIITMAHLKTKATTGNFREREKWKWQLIRGLYERGLTKQKIQKLFNIIDTMMTLPKQLQKRLVERISNFEEERKMALISPTIELAREEGWEKGWEEGQEEGEQRGKQLGEQQLITRQLKRRLGEIEPSLVAQVQTLSVEQLELLGEALLDFSTVADLAQWLNNT